MAGIQPFARAVADQLFTKLLGRRGAGGIIHGDVENKQSSEPSGQGRLPDNNTIKQVDHTGS